MSAAGELRAESTTRDAGDRNQLDAGHDAAETAQEAARKASATQNRSYPAVVVRTMLSRGLADPHAYADVVRESPYASSEIFLLLNGAFGMAFAQRIMKLAEDPEPATTTSQTSRPELPAVAPSPTRDASGGDQADDRGLPATGVSSLLDARAGTGGPLPHRSEMERSFGRSFGNVEAHTGMAAELAPLGAQALTIGRTVAFADSQPSPAVVTHEATHVAQNEQAGTAVAMASGVVAPRDSAAEAEADTNASLVVSQGPGARLPPVTAAPMASVHLAPKLLVPDADPPRTTTIAVPDADHPSKRDIDGQQVIQTDKAVDPGNATPLRGKSWSSLAEVAESVHVQDGSGDTLHIDITYRLESRPAEIGEVPDIWIHTERKALLTIGSGEHAGATIVGQARIRLAPEEVRDPKAAIAKASLGADHWAQIYLAEAQQYVNLHGAGGRASLLADAAGNDVLAYDDPLRTLVGLKNLLKQQHVAGRGGDVAKQHARAQQLLADAKRGRAVLEREIASIASYHDPHPGRVAPIRFLVGDIVEWLAANQQAGRDDTEDARVLRKARAELEHLIAGAENAHAPKRDQLDDALNAPVRFVERTAEGVAEAGNLAIDGVVLGVDGLGMATGIGSFEYHPRSKYLQAAEHSGAGTQAALVQLVNGFADEWADALERAKHGDYRSLTDVSIDTLMMIDGAQTGGMIALDKAETLAGKVGSVAKSARTVVQSAYASASAVPAEVHNIAAAMADGADAFLARLRAGGMQMATEGGGGGPGPNLGGLSAEALAEAAQAAKEAFKDKRAAQEPAKGKPASGHAPHHEGAFDLGPPVESAAQHETSYQFVEITNVNGAPIGEFDVVVHDGVATDRFIEDKSARGLKHPKNRKTPTEWAQRQIFEKTNTRIKNLEDAVGARPRPDGLGSPSVPTLDQLRTIREFEFVVESADPEVQAAVDAQLVNLRTQHPGFRFNAKFGK